MLPGSGRELLLPRTVLALFVLSLLVLARAGRRELARRELAGRGLRRTRSKWRPAVRELSGALLSGALLSGTLLSGVLLSGVLLPGTWVLQTARAVLLGPAAVLRRRRLPRRRRPLRVLPEPWCVSVCSGRRAVLL
jgi:hypothetical protein